MFLLKLISKLFRILGSNASPQQAAHGFALGSIWGLTPFWSLHNFFIILIIIILPVNVSAALFALVLFSFIAILFNPLFHSIGFELLVKFRFLESLRTALYNAPVIPFTRFHHTVITAFKGSRMVRWGVKIKKMGG